MKEPQQQQQTLRDEATLVVGGEETTLVAPRFDDGEALVARPVVPLDADASAPGHTAALPAAIKRSPYGPRRSWSLALVLVSALVGGVLGGAGLYLYQRQSQDPAVSPPAATTQQPADAAQAPAAPVADGGDTAQPEPPAQQPDAHGAEEKSPPAPDEVAPAAAPARAPESVPAAERRASPAGAAPKRGKKGDRDEEIERTTPRPAGNVARAEEPEARRVDTILYRQRRAERRAERRAARRARHDDVDRLRRIFEGTP